MARVQRRDVEDRKTSKSRKTRKQHREDAGIVSIERKKTHGDFDIYRDVEARQTLHPVPLPE